MLADSPSSGVARDLPLSFETSHSLIFPACSRQMRVSAAGFLLSSRFESLHAFNDIGDHQATQLIDLVDHVSLVVVFFHMELLPVKARLVQARFELAQSKWDQYRYGAPEVHWQAVAQLVQVDHHLHAPRLHADGSGPVGQAQQGDASLQVECFDRSNRSPDIHCLSDWSDRKPVASAP